jgi:hypothetical protein
VPAILLIVLLLSLLALSLFDYARWADIAPLLFLLVKILFTLCTLDLIQYVVRPRISVIIPHYSPSLSILQLNR